jgi:hypothetical protein
MRKLGLVLLLAAATLAASKSEKAKRHIDAVREQWKVYVLDRDTLTDDDLRGMIKNYDSAIELLQAVSEKEDNAAANSTILLLARRTAKFRFAIWSREMSKKAEAAEAAKAARPKPTPKPDDSGPDTSDPDRPAQKPDRPEPVEPDRGSRAAKRVPDEPPTIQIYETDKERKTNIRRLRKFVFEYFRHMKPGHIRKSCHKCNGAGKVRVRRREGRVVRWEIIDCRSCEKRGYAFHDDHARRGLWVTLTPAARADAKVRETHEAWCNTGRENPRDLEPITRVVIKTVDYRGLWATVQWKETRAKKVNTVKRTFIRLGRNWYFYTPETDAALLDIGDDAADEDPEEDPREDADEDG